MVERFFYWTNNFCLFSASNFVLVTESVTQFDPIIPVTRNSNTRNNKILVKLFFSFTEAYFNEVSTQLQVY